MDKSIIQLTQDLGTALSMVEKTHLKYLNSVRVAGELAEALKKATDIALSKPHIEIEDFEIDN